MVTAFDAGVVCVDCAAYIVNDDDSGASQGWREAWDKHPKSMKDVCVSIDSIMDGQDYSDEECQGCGTTRTGDRLALTRFA